MFTRIGRERLREESFLSLISSASFSPSHLRLSPPSSAERDTFIALILRQREALQAECIGTKLVGIGILRAELSIKWRALAKFSFLSLN